MSLCLLSEPTCPPPHPESSSPTWHSSFIKTGCHQFSALRENAARTITLYGGISALSLQSTSVFPLGIVHGAVQPQCVLVVTACLRFHRESWQLQCAGACQYKPGPQLTRLCVSWHNKTLHSFYKKYYHTYLSSKAVTWGESFISSLTLRGAALTRIHSVSPVLPRAG